MQACTKDASNNGLANAAFSGLFFRAIGFWLFWPLTFGAIVSDLSKSRVVARRAARMLGRQR
jgi:hypothetical protein